MNKLLTVLLALTLASCAGLTNKKLSLTADDAQKERIKENEDATKDVETESVEDSLFRSAQNAEGAGDIMKSGYYYDQLVDRYPKNKIYKYKYAESLRKMGSCNLAYEQYDALIKSDEKNLDYQEGKALCLLADTKYEEAGDIFTKIINADSKRWRSINGAGLIFASNKKYQEANQYLELAAATSGNSPTVLNNQALIKALVGNTDDAITLLNKASARAGDDKTQKRQIDLNLALIYGISGNMDMAQEVAKPHLTQSQLFNNMGVYAELAKDKELAKTYVNKALMDTPIFYDKAWNNLQRLDAE
jgi:Flp pilus assembly protein TadD